MKMLKIYKVVVILAFILYITVSFYKQVLKYEDIKKDIEYKLEIKPKRGSIYTSDNLEIALDLEYQSFILDPSRFETIEEINKMAEILTSVIDGLDYNDIVFNLTTKKEKGSRYYPFDKVLIDINQKTKIDEAIKKVKLEDKKMFKNKIITYSKVYKRNYLNNSVYETIVGFLDNESNGKYGLEHKYNDVLKGEVTILSGTRPYSARLGEYTLPYLIDQKVEKEGKDGSNLVLSLNSVFQYALDEILEKSYLEYTPVASMGIVMETDTGRILAMSSYPKATNRAEIKNLNITSLFEPGSIFKPITVASAINESKINENTLIHSDGYIKVRNRIVRDHDNTTKGTMPVSKIIAHSGNVGMVKISQMLESEIFYNYLAKFGLGQSTGIDISYETNSKLMTFKDFTEVRRSNVSFGQGINMNQMQIITALNATINGGKLLKPRIVDKIVSKDGIVLKENKTEIKSQVITEDTSYKIRKMLEEVVSTGTGKGIQLDGYRIGGKTGTAQKSGQYGYEAGKYFSSFFAFFPADKPKYTILITVDEPKGAYYGASVALPLVRDILHKIIQYENISPLENSVDKMPEDTMEKEKLVNVNQNLSKIKESLNNNIMPNFIGLTKKNILNLELEKYNVRVNGKGKVIAQIPSSGTVIKQGDSIILELE